jgi:lipid-A-disaccharide synthase
MKPFSFMVVAGEASGDLLAAELVAALRDELAKAQSRFSPDPQAIETSLAPRFFGAGGPRMRAAGVDVALDLTEHAAIGLDGVRKYFEFRRYRDQLVRMAVERQPDAIICVDFSGFNMRLASAIRGYTSGRQRKPFHNWRPRIVQYVSPQVWASRAGRARRLERDVDLLLSIFPFEKDWYALHAPRLRVDYVGHPVVDRYAMLSPSTERRGDQTVIAVLPGSRASELRRHLPVLRDAAHEIATSRAVEFYVVLPTAELAETSRGVDWPQGTRIIVGGLPETLQQATIALASTGTVTMECAYFGVPAVAIYKTSWLTFEVGKRIVTVGYLAMPNVLAGHEIFPEFIQHNATGHNIARAALELMESATRQAAIREKLRKIISSLGPSGAARRAARAVAASVSDTTR